MPIAPDGGVSLPYPPGDPGGVRAAAGRLTTAGHEFDTIAGTVRSEAGSLLADWTGQAAGAFGRVADVTHTGLTGMSPIHAGAASALQHFADVLERAQAQARRAQVLYDEAWSAYQSACNTAANQLQAAANEQGQQAQVDAQAAAQQMTAAQNQFSAASASATKLATDAVDDAKQAGDAAARAIENLGHELRSLTHDKIVMVLGAPGFLMTIAGLDKTLEGSQNALRLLQVFNALRSSDFDRLVELEEEGFKAAAKAAETFGENSPQAIKAWLEFQSGALGDAAQEAADGIGQIDRAASAGDELGELSLLSKVGMGVSVIGDIGTLSSWGDNWKNGTLGKADDLASLANLGGVGMVAAGTDAGGAALGLIGVNAVADWVPGVGEVVMGATALYLAGSWAAEHWSTIEHAGASVVHAVEWVNSKETQLLEDAAQTGEHLVVGLGHEAVATIDAAGSLVHAGVSTAEHLGSEGLHLASEGLSTAGHVAGDLGSGALDAGKTAVHYLNPLNW